MKLTEGMRVAAQHREANGQFQPVDRADLGTVTQDVAGGWAVEWDTGEWDELHENGEAKHWPWAVRPAARKGAA